MDAPVIVCGIIFFGVVVGMPVALLLRSGKYRTKEDVASMARETPRAYLWCGGALSAMATMVFAISCFGYLLPGLGWIEKNRLSDIPISIRRGRHGRESDPLSIHDTDMTLLISSISFVVLVFGVLLLWRGFKLSQSTRR
jgi:hypothetical protein